MQSKPDDYVLAAGESHSVREFIELAFAQVGRNIGKGKGDDEVGFLDCPLPVLLECLRTQSYKDIDVLVSVDAPRAGAGVALLEFRTSAG
jgi:GDP-D-mannose dehydratase